MATSGWKDVTAADVARMGRKAVPGRKAGRSKYGAVKVTIDGITFDSKAEARRYVELKALQSAGAISHLLLQPVYRLMVKPMVGDGEYETVGKYIGDFQYETVMGLKVVEDVKGVRTPIYRLKKKIVERLYGIQIREI